MKFSRIFSVRPVADFFISLVVPPNATIFFESYLEVYVRLIAVEGLAIFDFMFLYFAGTERGAKI